MLKTFLWKFLGQFINIAGLTDRTKADRQSTEDGLPIGLMTNWWHFGRMMPIGADYIHWWGVCFWHSLYFHSVSCTSFLVFRGVLGALLHCLQEDQYHRWPAGCKAIVLRRTLGCECQTVFCMIFSKNMWNSSGYNGHPFRKQNVIWKNISDICWSKYESNLQGPRLDQGASPYMAITGTNGC